jgi:hypothetical protein
MRMTLGIAIVLIAAGGLGGALCPAGAGTSLENSISVYSGQNGHRFMQPLADALVANLNSGLYYTAAIPTNGFEISVGIEGMYAPIGSDAKTFEATTEGVFSPVQTADVPTIFGDTEGLRVTGTGGTAYTFPGGFAVDNFPTAVPQITIGAFHGTEATVRFATANTEEEIGKIDLLGFGLRHSISQYLPNAPVDIAAGFFWQSFKIGDIMDAKALSLGVQGSYTRSVLTAYAGLAYETGSLKLDYTQEVAGETLSVDFDLDAANSIRGTLGLTLDLMIARLHAEYGLASQSTLTVGLGLGHWK